MYEGVRMKSSQKENFTRLEEHQVEIVPVGTGMITGESRAVVETTRTFIRLSVFQFFQQAIAVKIELVLGVFNKVSKVVCVSFELSEGIFCWLITTRSYSPSISGFGGSWDPLVST